MAEQTACRVANLHRQLVLLFHVEAEHALETFQERQGPIALQVEVQRENDLGFKLDELIAGDLLAQHFGQSIDHHIEAGVHVLVHFRGQQY